MRYEVVNQWYMLLLKPSVCIISTYLYIITFKSLVSLVKNKYNNLHQSDCNKRNAMKEHFRMCCNTLISCFSHTCQVIILTGHQNCNHQTNSWTHVRSFCLCWTWVCFSLFVQFPSLRTEFVQYTTFSVFGVIEFCLQLHYFDHGRSHLIECYFKNATDEVDTIWMETL